MGDKELLVSNPATNPVAASKEVSLGCSGAWKAKETPLGIVALLLHSIYTTCMGRRPKSDEDQVANKVEDFRTQAGLSRQELAEEVGVHYQTIGYIERGEYSPSLVLALRIASVLGASVEEIFWLEEEN